MARPWFKFNATVWLGDSRLCSVSPAARGVWMDLLCFMHQSEERGVLITGGVPWGIPEIVRRARCGRKLGIRAVSELESSGILCRRPDGAYFSKRMVEDEKQLQSDKDNGAKGGNPDLKKGVNPRDKARDKNKEQRINNPIVPLEIPDSLKPAESQIREWIA